MVIFANVHKHITVNLSVHVGLDTVNSTFNMEYTIVAKQAGKLLQVTVGNIMHWNTISSSKRKGFDNDLYNRI